MAMGACRLCGESDLSVVQGVSALADGGEYGLVRCLACGFVSVSPMPGAGALAAHYASGYWDRGRAGSGVRLFNRIRQAGLLRVLRGTVTSGGRILDYGCGDGAFVELLRAAGFAAEGLDPYAPPDEAGGLRRGEYDAPGLEAGSYDGVTCLHVLEHVPDPVAVARGLGRLLRPGGVVLVEVPNIASLEFDVFKGRWQPLQLPGHLNHFSPRTLRRCFLAEEGWELLWQGHFSLKASPAATVLSLAPGMAPKERRRKKGQYPLPEALLYLGLQVAALPWALVLAALKRGAFLRACFRKTNE